ncbi:Tfp pilus assembly protein FimT/FimU [Leptolyngbya sp. 7M]|uniref:pilus assembly FimT family protein n=1 Tax=Leptolyngbya sp. 7M TaxID=2812896 RepID=UPI001B8D560B|nr:prepilin-type N-terminal cleavage/methylation domain-containing protein [Leptolyngbya sp. 7M]QYO62845.1 prepilin-type N-terminal cleavage/methylation domain-containing protein [Leptolyngbya sp. 7M]
MSKLAPYRSTAGFTLVEMIVVIMLAVILALIAAPGWLSFANSRRAEAGREQIFQLLRQAQTQAIRSRQNQVVNFIAPPDQLPAVKIAEDIVQPIDGQDPNSQGNANLLKLEVSSNAKVGCAPDAVGCVVFNDRGNIAIEANDLGENGIVISVSSPADNTNINSRRCVIVKTLLGAMATSSGEDCKLS